MLTRSCQPDQQASEVNTLRNIIIEFYKMEHRIFARRSFAPYAALQTRLIKLPRILLSICGAAVILCVSGSVFGHDPVSPSKDREGSSRLPTLVEPVPLLKNPRERGNPITNFEFIVGERYGVWQQEVYEIGKIVEEQNEVRLAVVRAYEPGAAIAHVTEATAVRIDVETRDDAKRSARGWLDSQEVAQIVAAIPGMTKIPRLSQAIPGEAKADSYVQVAVRRGAIALGFHLVAGNFSSRRLFIRVGHPDSVTVYFKPERFVDLETLMNSANRTIREVRDKRGHHH
jgi:hypothetical protein